jgi:hypothetical protein
MMDAEIIFGKCKMITIVWESVIFDESLNTDQQIKDAPNENLLSET